MSLFTLIATLVIVGVVMWLINAYVPMEAKIKTILNIAVAIIIVLWILQSFGILGSVGNMDNVRVK